MCIKSFAFKGAHLFILELAFLGLSNVIHENAVEHAKNIGSAVLREKNESWPYLASKTDKREREEKIIGFSAFS